MVFFQDVLPAETRPDLTRVGAFPLQSTTYLLHFTEVSMGQVKNSLLDLLNDEDYRERLCLMDLLDPVEPDFPGMDAGIDPLPHQPFNPNEERPF